MQIGMSLGMRKPSGLTTIQRALAVLRKFGTAAHIWLPGVGSINGLQAANYLLSDASTGLAPVDQYVGRVSDALGGLGVELITNGDFSNGVVNWVESAPGHWAVVGGRAYHAFSSLYKELGQTFTTKPAGPSYKISIAYEVTSGSAQFFYVNEAGTAQVTVFTASSGVVEKVITDGIKKIGFSRANSGGEFYIDNISVREVTGIHLVQGTTANKPQLKLVGNSHRWVFDATDLLTCTMPAGYETATTIDAKPTGQVTLQGQNIVGAYSIGPNLTTSGRIVLKYAPSASDLVLLQNLANRLAGL